MNQESVIVLDKKRKLNPKAVKLFFGELIFFELAISPRETLYYLTNWLWRLNIILIILTTIPFLIFLSIDSSPSASINFNFLIGAAVFSPVFLIFLTILTYIIARAEFKNFSYEFTDKEFIGECGIFPKTRTIIPYNQIRSVEIIKPSMVSITGIFNFYALKIISKSQGILSSIQFIIPALTYEEAESLRREIIDKVGPDFQSLKEALPIISKRMDLVIVALAILIILIILISLMTGALDFSIW